MTLSRLATPVYVRHGQVPRRDGRARDARLACVPNGSLPCDQLVVSSGLSIYDHTLTRCTYGR